MERFERFWFGWSLWTDIHWRQSRGWRWRSPLVLQLLSISSLPASHQFNESWFFLFEFQRRLCTSFGRTAHMWHGYCPQHPLEFPIGNSTLREVNAVSGNQWYWSIGPGLCTGDVKETTQIVCNGCRAAWRKLQRTKHMIWTSISFRVDDSHAIQSWTMDSGSASVSRVYWRPQVLYYSRVQVKRVRSTRIHVNLDR